MMDCSQFRELLPDLDRPGALPAEVRDSAFVHAEVCSDCGQLLTESESLDSALRRLIVKDGHARAAVRVEAHLLQAFREQKSAAARESVGQFAALIGIAAMLLLSLGFWLYRHSEVRVAPPTITPASEPGPAQVNARLRDRSRDRQSPQVAQETGSKSAPAGRQAASQALQTASNDSNQLAGEDASSFIPLPDADYPVTLDDGAVVRVEMPRAALASFGLPVAAMEGSGTVRADLIVSADGTPQAIRLVSQGSASESAQK